MSMVLYICDTETTGLNHDINDIIELSFLRMSWDGKSWQEDQKTWWLRAMNPKAIEDKALQVNGYLREDILGVSAAGRKKHLLPTEQLPEIVNWILDDNVSSMDRFFIGQNPNFDLEMLKSLFKRNGFAQEEDFPFAIENGNRLLDTKQIVTLFDLCVGRRRKQYSLKSLAKACGTKCEKSHTAEGDVKTTKYLLVKLLDIIKEVVQKDFSDCYLDGDD